MRARGSHCLPDTKALLDTLQATARENADRGFGDALKGAKDATLNNMPLPYLEKIIRLTPQSTPFYQIT